MKTEIIENFKKYMEHNDYFIFYMSSDSDQEFPYVAKSREKSASGVNLIGYTDPDGDWCEGGFIGYTTTSKKYKRIPTIAQILAYDRTHDIAHGIITQSYYSIF